MNNKFCIECRFELPITAKFCKKCGVEITLSELVSGIVQQEQVARHQYNRRMKKKEEESDDITGSN